MWNTKYTLLTVNWIHSFLFLFFLLNTMIVTLGLRPTYKSSLWGGRLSLSGKRLTWDACLGEWGIWLGEWIVRLGECVSIDSGVSSAQTIVSTVDEADVLTTGASTPIAGEHGSGVEFPTWASRIWSTWRLHTSWPTSSYTVHNTRAPTDNLTTCKLRGSG